MKRWAIWILLIVGPNLLAYLVGKRVTDHWWQIRVPPPIHFDVQSTTHDFSASGVEAYPPEVLVQIVACQTDKDQRYILKDFDLVVPKR